MKAGTADRFAFARGVVSIAASVLFLTAPGVASAQETTETNDPPRHVIQARPVTSPLTIDGRLDPEEWDAADVAKGFVQYQPRRGEAESQPTEALVLYDEETLYIAFRVADALTPTAQLTRRDSDLMEDDSAVVVLDTFLDRQSAYIFGVNALGTIADGRIANDGRTIDLTWDGTWSAAVQRDGNDWTAELAIPLRSLQYSAGESVSWGINFMRTRRRSLETSTWAGPLDAEFRISQAGTLMGLNIQPPQDRLSLIPYGQATFQEREYGAWRAGGDVRFAATSTTSINATINPDFALIEADQEQVNLSRFELRLPEKRPFFLEGDELFRQRIRTFYSRRIEDITVGAKTLGRQGAWTTAAYYTRATPAGATDGAPDGDFGVVRLQRDLGRSNIGIIGAGRNFEGDGRGSVGLDTTLFFTDFFGLTAQLVKSFGDNDGAGAGGGTLGYFLRPSYDAPTAHFHVRYSYLGDRFADNVNAIGFVRDDNRRELDSALSKTFWPTGSAFERIEYDSNYNVYWAANSDTLRSWQIVQGVEVDLRNRLSFEVGWEEEYILFEKGFRNRQFEVEVGYNTRAFEQVRIGYQWGRNFDADFRLYTAAAAYKLTDQLSAEYELQRLTLDPDPEDETTWIHVLRAEQFFTPDLFVKVFLQTNSAIDRRNIQLTFVYRYQPPFGTLQLAYQRGTAEFGEKSDQGNTLFVKLTTVF